MGQRIVVPCQLPVSLHLEVHDRLLMDQISHKTLQRTLDRQVPVPTQVSVVQGVFILPEPCPELCTVPLP